MILTDEEAISGSNRPILKLIKNLYGLKQAGRLWHQMLDEKLRALKYSQSSVDMCLYYQKSNTIIILVGIYVDDLLVTSNYVKLIDEFFEEMKTFDVKDLGEAEKFLGIKIESETAHGYSMSQKTMIESLIDQFGLNNAKPVGTPIAEVVHAAEDMNPLNTSNASLFRTLAGALLWIARCTRPDIGFAVHHMTRKTHAPRVCDFKPGKRILHYLSGTSDYKLEVKRIDDSEEVCLEVYTDADWAGENRKSVNAALTYLNGMSWHCNKQALVSLSTMEREFVSASRGKQEAVGCYYMVKELGQPIRLPIQLRMDNQAAIATIMNEASSSKKNTWI
jgi:hypothetical protein